MSQQLRIFITTCINEDERIAKAATACSCGRCTFSAQWTREGDRIPELGMEVMHTSAPGFINPEHANHIVNHDPARTLRRVAAHRRILAETVRDMRQQESRIDEEWATGEPVDHSGSDLLVSLLAQEYRGRDGWRDAWAA